MITIILILSMMRVATICDRLEEERLLPGEAESAAQEKKDGEAVRP